MANDKDVKKTVQAPANAAEPKKVPTIDDILASGEFEKTSTGFDPYWNPRMFCPGVGCVEHAAAGEPGRRLGDREFECKLHDGKVKLIGSVMMGQILDREVSPGKPKENGESNDFVRWILLATRTEVACQKGPAADAESVMVEVGQAFTLSEYKVLPFRLHYGDEVIVRTKSKRAIADGKTLWEFDFFIPKDVKQLNQAKRLEAAKHAKAFFAAQAAKEFAAKRAEMNEGVFEEAPQASA